MAVGMVEGGMAVGMVEEDKMAGEVNMAVVRMVVEQEEEKEGADLDFQYISPDILVHNS